MSKTDKTRPGRVNEADPLNQRFLKIGSMEHFFKRMGDVRGCWCCSQKHQYASEQRSNRTKWKQDRRKLEKGGWHDET